MGSPQRLTFTLPAYRYSLFMFKTVLNRLFVRRVPSSLQDMKENKYERTNQPRPNCRRDTMTSAQLSRKENKGQVCHFGNRGSKRESNVPLVGKYRSVCKGSRKIARPFGELSYHAVRKNYSLVGKCWVARSEETFVERIASTLFDTPLQVSPLVSNSARLLKRASG